ncbi:TonB-dependent receptor domain-containing protein [Elongatibacter sediminis]|uniref:TonB-dependent receptor domain-containing protein n=1 Tax=Elongatibacter sediminis TaxID=3119006 RepID=UPI00339D3A2B
MLEEVVVTGSRLKQADEFVAPIPVAMMRAEDLRRSAPTSIADALNQKPVFANSLSNNNGTEVDFTQQAGGNFLNMRSLGPERLLVLLDGRRVPPTNANGIVDVNLMPQLLLERVDVVKAGVSAVYGADAVSGVVNYVIDKDFTGWRGYAQGGESSRGDNEMFAAGLAWGGSFQNDRLHVLLSVEHTDSDGIGRKSERRLHDPGYLLTGSGTAADPYRVLSDVRQSSVTYGGFIGSGPFAGQHFIDSNTLAPYDPGQPAGRGYQMGGDGVDWGNGGLIPSLETDSLFGRVSWEINPNASVFVQAAYGESRTEIDNHLDFNFFGMTIFSGNPYLPDFVQQGLTDTGTPAFVMSRIHRDFGFLVNDFRNEALNLTVGAEGVFANEWSWDIYYTYGDVEMDGRVHNQTQPVNVAAALDAVLDTNGNIVCNVTLTHPGRFDDCVPLNIFGEGSPSQAAIDFVTGTTIFLVEHDLNEVGVAFSGSPLTVPAGPVQTAFGASHRRLSIRQTGNSDPSQPVDATGIRGVYSTLPFSVGNYGSADGSVEVDEFFAEGSVPVLADRAWAYSLELNGAVRYIDHSTFGGETVWKLGFTYEPFADLRLRFTRSADIRAPSLFNLFASTQQIIAPVSDPLTGVSGITAQIGGGNPNLNPESADTVSFGLGYRPNWLPGLTLSVDYYDIEITDAINTVNSQTIVDVCHASGYTDPLCDLVTRPFPVSNTTPENFPTAIASLTSINIGFLRTKGFDIEAAYQFEPDRLGGNLHISASANHVSSFEVNNGTGGPTLEFEGVYGPGLVRKSLGGLPEWRANLVLTYERAPWTFFVQERFIDSLDRIGGVQPNAVYADGSNHIESMLYTDITVEFEFPAAEVRVFASVNNLFDKDAPPVPSTSFPNLYYPAAGSVHDLVGRYFTLGIRGSFD